MKNLLIVFIVLLFLLTLLGSFGGSIRPAEPFYDGTPAYTMPGAEHFFVDAAKKKALEHFYEEKEKEEAIERFYEEEKEKEVFPAPGTATAATTGAPPSYLDATPSMTMPTPPSTSEQIAVVEKFEVPEPFMSADADVGAPF